MSPSEAIEGLQRPLQGFSWHYSLFKGLSKASKAFHGFKGIFKGQISLKAQKQFFKGSKTIEREHGPHDSKETPKRTPCPKGEQRLVRKVKPKIGLIFEASNGCKMAPRNSAAPVKSSTQCQKTRTSERKYLNFRNK